ncbi:hypothetical protein, partial [Mycobacterium intracellulare]
PVRRSAGSPRSRAGHHGSGQRYATLGANQAAGRRQQRRTRALEGQRYG